MSMLTGRAAAPAMEAEPAIKASEARAQRIRDFIKKLLNARCLKYISPGQPAPRNRGLCGPARLAATVILTIEGDWRLRGFAWDGYGTRPLKRPDTHDTSERARIFVDAKNGNDRPPNFDDPGDYAAFERVLVERVLEK